MSTPSGVRSALSAAAMVLAVAVAARAADPRPGPLRVAILAFDSTSEDAQYATLGSGLQAMLATDLAASPVLQIIEREKLAALQTELALSKTAAIDRATAVKAGKLLGASHLLVGAIAVVGPGMRIDARLVDATSGEVVLADKIEGDKALFFELEKALAQQLIAALGAPLTPKERARLAKIHTADFDAFRRFSDGIAAFDHQAFDEARKAMRDALARDGEFQLARLTLDDYELIIDKLAARTDLLEAGIQQAKVEARTAQAAEQQRILERHFALAQDRDPLVRLPALYALTRWHDVRDDRSLELHVSGDAFLVARTCDMLVQTYVAEAEKAFPKVPVFGTREFVGRPPASAEKVETDQARWLARFLGTTSDSEAQRHGRLLRDLESAVNYRDFARHLQLDVAGEARMAERVYKLGLKLEPDEIDAFFKRKRLWRESFMRMLGVRFREAGELDQSTRWFAEAGRAAQEPNDARRAAEEVEKNRDITAFLAAHKHPRLREWMMLRGFRLPTDRHEKEWSEALERDPLEPKGRSVLAHARAIHANRDEPYIILGERPIYPADGTFFATGKRTDPLRASDLDYYRRPSKAAGEEWWHAFFEGQHQGVMSATFALRYTPDADWGHTTISGFEPSLEAGGYVAARPEVLFLFGARDISVPLVDDDAPPGKRMQRGLRAYGLRISQDRIELVRVSEPEVRAGHSIARDRLSFEVLDSAEGAIKDGVKVTVSLRGREVRATVGTLSVDETLGAAPAGFTGLSLLGPGHLTIVAPKVTIGK